MSACRCALAVLVAAALATTGCTLTLESITLDSGPEAQQTGDGASPDAIDATVGDGTSLDANDAADRLDIVAMDTPSRDIAEVVTLDVQARDAIEVTVGDGFIDAPSSEPAIDGMSGETLDGVVTVDAADASDAVDVTDANVDACPPPSLVTCGVGICARTAMSVCGAPAMCTPGTPEAPACNGLDNDCNGIIDQNDPSAIPPLPPCGLGACQVTPAPCATSCTPGTPSPEICGNAIDENCNGVLDDGCDCTIYVSPLNTTAGDGSMSRPFSTIGAAMALAASSATLPQRICVASGFSSMTAACTPHIYPEIVTMLPSVSLFGSYDPMTWTRSPNCATVLAPPAQSNTFGTETVIFGHNVTRSSQIDGFGIVGPAASDTGTPSSAGVLVQNGGVISNCAIAGGLAATSVGIFAEATGQTPTDSPLIANDTIAGFVPSAGGSQPPAAIGIHVLNHHAEIRNNMTITGGPAMTKSFGILLDSSPQTTVLDNNAILGGDAPINAAIQATNGQDGTVIARNAVISGANSTSVLALTPQTSRGIDLANCQTGPWTRVWIAQNNLIAGAPLAGGATSTMGSGVGIVASGCVVRIEANGTIVGRRANGGEAVGVNCDGLGSTFTRCVLAANDTVTGYDAMASGGLTSSGTGVLVTNGAMGIVAHNGAIDGCAGTAATCHGVRLLGAAPGTIVDANTVLAPNPTASGTGIVVETTTAYVANNLVFASGTTGIDVDIASSAAAATIVTSNTVIGIAPNGGLTRSTDLLRVSSNGVAIAPGGAFENNIAWCDSGTGGLRAFAEQDLTTRPAVLRNNDLASSCSTLYLDDGLTSLTDIMTINTLADIPSVGANISDDPQFVDPMGDYRLQPGSPCIDTGTSMDAPASDYFGTSRPLGLGYDIGFQEQ